MDERLRIAERLYESEPTYENLAKLINLRIQHGLDVNDLGEDAKTIAWQLQCKHPGIEYFQDEHRYWDPEFEGYLTEKYHWYECFECGYQEGGEGWKDSKWEPHHPKDWNDLPQFRRNPNPNPNLNLDEIEYIGIFLTPQSKEKLKRAIPATFKQKSGDHITLIHEPDEEQLMKFAKNIGKKVVLTATHVIENDRVQALRIKDVWTERGTPHITISWADGASPAESNALASTEQGTPIQPWLKLEGVIDVFPQTEMKRSRNPQYRRNADEELRRLERRYHAGEPPGRYIAALQRVLGGDTAIPQTPTEGLEFHKTLTLSTAHITQEEGQLLTTFAADEDAPWMVWDHFGYGWWVRIPDSSEQESWQEAAELFPPNLFQLMLFALGHDCSWLQLDADGLEAEGLPTFEW